MCILPYGVAKIYSHTTHENRSYRSQKVFALILLHGKSIAPTPIKEVFSLIPTPA